ASCPICREFFRDPVSIHCGHHFCRACIERRWEWPTGGFACPRCRDAAPLRPSRELARVLEIARRLSRGEALGLAPGPGGFTAGGKISGVSGGPKPGVPKNPSLWFVGDSPSPFSPFQDLSGTLSSLGQEKPPLLPPPLPELGMRIRRFREENLPLEEALRTVRDLLVFELPEKMSVTLDPRTAHPQLRVAPDGSSVSWEPNRDPPEPEAEPGPEPEPEPPEPEPEPCPDPSVLGREGVTAGQRCWDVRVAPDGSWALGVALETPGSTPGSGPGTPGSPGWELWSMGLCQGQFWALTSQERIPLFPARAPGTVRVALDYERGQVAFFDADQRSLIFAFPAAAFQGRRARPWFLVWGEGSRLALCP
ncbi:PREDICTED: tripartite motif-containing protein 7-like, partial [Ficedula albicollis]|uniref:tripartite motif-containing protein 7-like n=1 Tax=Ficedula albicollis TaxID=59894 RepID=UPI0003594F30